MTDLVLAYAKALYSLSEETRTEDKLLYEISEISDLLSENPDFIKLLNSPALSLDERLCAAQDAFGQCEEILVNFVKLLTENRHMHIFRKCAEMFENEYNISHNIENVTVETAIPLNESNLKLLKDKLESVTGKKIVIKTVLNPKLLGGAVVKMCDRRYDGSILKKLSDIHSDIHNVIV